MTTENQPISDFTLERHRLGELPIDEAALVARRATADPRLQARLDALAVSDDEIRATYGDDWLERPVIQRLHAARPPARGGRVRLAIAAGIVVAVALLPSIASRLRPGPLLAPGLTTPPANRVKGEVASLQVYRNSAAGSEALRDGDAARRGDLIRVAYRAFTPRFGIIISIDGRGVVTRHLPVAGDSAAPLQPGEETPLADAYELDDAPRWERFFLITSETAFAVGPVLDAARAAAAVSGAEAPPALALPAGFDQTSFLLRKIS